MESQPGLICSDQKRQENTRCCSKGRLTTRVLHTRTTRSDLCGRSAKDTWSSSKTFEVGMLRKVSSIRYSRKSTMDTTAWNGVLLNLGPTEGLGCTVHLTSERLSG